MSTFKLFFLVIKKNLNSVLLYLGIFLALCILFTTSDNNMEKFEEVQAYVGVSDGDQSEISKAVVEYLSKTQKVSEVSSDKDKMTDALFNGDVECIVVIPEGFGESLIEGNVQQLATYHSPDSTTYSFLEMQIEEFLGAYSFYLKNGYDPKEALDKAEENVQIEAEVEMQGKDTGRKPSYYYFYLYLAYIFICIAITGIGPVLATFNRKDLVDRLSCSGQPASKRNLSIYAGMISYAVGIYAVFMLLGKILYPQEWENTIWYFIIAAVYLYVCVSITFLLGCFAKSYNSLTMMSNILGLGMSFLGGVFVPLEYMGDAVVKMAHILPSYWYVIALEQLQADEVHMADMGKPIGVLFAYGIVLVVVALLCKRKRA